MPSCASSEGVPEGVGDNVSSAAQVIADDQAQNLSACGGRVHLADVVDGAGGGACFADDSADQGQVDGGWGLDGGHRGRLN